MNPPAQGRTVDSHRRGDLPAAPDLLCLSHLRWNFVFQRPQQLMTRFARDRRVFFFEEPLFDVDAGAEWLEQNRIGPNLLVAVPHLARGGGSRPPAIVQRAFLDDLIASESIRDVVLWYWTPMSLLFTRQLAAKAIVYDCMDELSGFAGAPAALPALECDLLARADVVFTGGYSLYAAKAASHPNVHAFPSSVDVVHFARARSHVGEPSDQSSLARPRIGYFGVIDERMDLALIERAAALEPDWQWVLLGPTAKIDPAMLPRRDNIHYLGMKPYDALPDYLSGWDVAVLPFARNAATRFISPTKTPEYLAAGCPVVSTSIPDVVRPYGELGLVRIADDAGSFVAAARAAMADDRDARLAQVDRFLAGQSWDAVVDGMRAQIAAALASAGRAGLPTAHALASTPISAPVGATSTHP